MLELARDISRGKMRRATSPSSKNELLSSRFREAGRMLKFRRRQAIFSVGDNSDAFYFIESGSAKLTLTSQQGKEAVISVLHAGDFFGESALRMDRALRSTNAVAITELRALKIERDAMLHLLHTQSDTCDAFISRLVEVISQLNSNIAGQLLYGSEQRLARVLLSVAHLRQHEESQLLPKMSQQDIANMIGITRQRVNTLLKRFKEQGLVDYAGGLRVHSSIRSAARLD